MGVCPSGKWLETREEAQGFSPSSHENFTEGVVHKCPWAQREKPLAQWWLFNYLMSSDAVLTLFSHEPHRVKASWSCWGCWNLPHPKFGKPKSCLSDSLLGESTASSSCAGATLKPNCFLSYFPFPLGNLQVHNVKYEQELLLKSYSGFFSSFCSLFSVNHSP